MKPLLQIAVHVLRLVNLISMVTPTVSSRTGMIQIVHPDLELYFLEMLRSAAVSERKDQFSEMSKEQKRQLCLSSVQSSSFYITDDKRSNLTLTRYDVGTAVENINGWYDTNIPDAVKYYSVATAMKGVVLKVNAHRCQSTPEMKWFLTHGDRPDTYIILNKDHKDFYTIRGLLEPAPEITPIPDFNSKYALDNWFMRKMAINNSRETAKRRNKSICELTRLQKIRLCSAVYVVYQSYMGGKVKSTNIVEGSKNLCLENALVELEADEYTVDAATMDLIPCTFSEKLSAPIFYLADDVHSENSAFVLHQIDDTSKSFDERPLPEQVALGTDSSSIITFRLTLHVQKLTQL